MSNGSSGPVPGLSADIWDTIKNLDITGDGGWTLESVDHFLYLVRDGTLGGCKWALTSEGDAPTNTFQAPMSTSDWAGIKGGTLNTSTNVITKSSSDYQVGFYNISGASKAVRIDL